MQSSKRAIIRNYQAEGWKWYFLMELYEVRKQRRKKKFKKFLRNLKHLFF